MQNNGGNVYQQQNQNTNVQKNKWSFGKIYGCVVLIGIILFFLMSILGVILRVVADIHFSRIISGFKILVSMFFIMFGWVPALIITSNNKK